MNREQYKAHIKALADATISKTLERSHHCDDPAPEFLMKIESHEISAHEVIKADPWCRISSSWPAIYEHTYHQPIAKLLNEGLPIRNEMGLVRPEFMRTLAYCALLQDVIRAVEYKLSWLKEAGADLRNFLPTAVL